MTDFSQLFMYIPGIIIFLVGSGQVRRHLRVNRKGYSVDVSVVSCNHVVKKDKKDREVYNYYNVTVEYVNPETKHTERQAIKSPTEFAVGQQIRMFRDKDSEKNALAEAEGEFLFHPWVTMIGGALLIILALMENQGREVEAMLCLSVILAGAGADLLANYISLKKRGLQEIDAVVTDIYTRQISKESKILKGSKFTYYPIVRYELNGRQNIRRCNINSSGQNTFKTGDTMKLWYDPKNHTVLEKHARTGAAAAGVILVGIGLLAGLSILSVIL